MGGTLLRFGRLVLALLLTNLLLILDELAEAVVRVLAAGTGGTLEFVQSGILSGVSGRHEMNSVSAQISL